MAIRTLSCAALIGLVTAAAHAGTVTQVSISGANGLESRGSYTAW